MAIVSRRLEARQQYEKSARGISQLDFWSVEGLGAGSTKTDAILAAQTDGEPNMPDVGEVFEGLPCTTVGFSQWLSVTAGGTQGAIVYARCGVGGIGGGVPQSLRESAAQLVSGTASQPWWTNADGGWRLRLVPTPRPRSLRVYSGVIDNSAGYSKEQIKDDIDAFAGYYRVFSDPNRPYIFVGADFVDRPGVLRRYSLVFATNAKMPFVPALPGNPPDIEIPALNHLEDWIPVEERDGQLPKNEVRRLYEYSSELPANAFPWADLP